MKHVVVIFNPADITGLITLLHSGLKPSQVTTLAALDSTRLQSELAKFFNVPQSAVTGCRTYGGHGEQMAVFASTAKVDGTPLLDLIGTDKLPADKWAEIQQKGDQRRSQHHQLARPFFVPKPAYVSVEMIRAAMGGEAFRWPAGRYVSFKGFDHVMMAVEATITSKVALMKKSSAHRKKWQLCAKATSTCARFATK